MAKDLIVYKAPNKGTTAKGNIWARRKAVGRKMKMGVSKFTTKYGKYTAPTVGMFKKTGSAALGVGKFALKRGVLGFPGLIAGAGYYGAKAIGKKIVSRQKGLEFSPYRQYNKKGRKII